jgi:hypothetical protein
VAQGRAGEVAASAGSENVLTFDLTTQRYRDADGREVDDETIQRLLLLLVADTAADLSDLTRMMAAGDISIGTWQDTFAEQLRGAYLAAAALAVGGFDRLTDQDYATVSADLRFAYTRLERFARFVEQRMRDADSAGRVLARSRLYARYVNGLYQRLRTASHRRAVDGEGNRLFLFEANVLGVAEHCAQCLEETDRGWVPIGTLVPVGERICLANCKCRLAFSLIPVDDINPNDNAPASAGRR